MSSNSRAAVAVSVAGTSLRQVLAASLNLGQRFPRTVVLGWLLLGAIVTVFVTPLGTVVERSTTAFLPNNSSTLTGLRAMDSAFGTGRTSSYVFVVMSSEKKLDSTDQQLYATLVQKLRTEPGKVSEVQSYLGDRQAQKALTSKDGKATYIAVGIPAPVGSPTADRDVRWLRSYIASLDTPPGTQLYVTGDPAMISDLTTAVNNASSKVTGVTVALLLIILWLVYRRWVTVLVPLATIGIALVCARGLLALAGEHGVSLSTYTDAFIIALTLGAGTDYCVFLISRFREEYATGKTPAQALTIATNRIGPALLASAATVILGAVSLSFADLAIFATTGPAMAICVAVTVLVSLTFTPALLHWFGPRIGPAPAFNPNSRWVKLGDLIRRRPAKVLLASTAVLLILAAFTPTMRLSFDEREAQPSDTPSNLGLAAMAEHFPPNETLPDYLLVRSSHDMRNTRDLAVLNAVSIAVSKVPGVDLVRSITQPAGTPLKPAVIAEQLGDLAAGLNKANRKLESGQPDLDRLSAGTSTLNNALGRVDKGAGAAANGAGELGTGTRRLSSGLGQAADGTGRAAAGSSKLKAGADQLADGLETTHDLVAAAVAGLEQVVTALNGDLLCSADPVCNRARKGLRQIAAAQRQELLPGLAQAADGARRLASGNGQLADGLDKITAGLQKARIASSRIADGQNLLAERLSELASGTERISAGTDDLSQGVDEFIAQANQLRKGLGRSASYLSKVNKSANTPTAGGFYLPADALENPNFARARKVYLSKDGTLARIQVVGATDPLTHSGQARYGAVRDAAQQALRGTRLSRAEVTATGAGGLGADLKHYLYKDARLVFSCVLLVVFLVLVLSLRALVAPLYLLASVVLSCGAALGLTTLIFQHIGGTDIGFMVPVMVFVLLVAVGADYNILLMSRMRENGLNLTRAGVAEAVTSTGPVITAAGIIFAATFVALLFAPLTNLAEIGFAVGAGLLLDTFVVRSMVVPACAALLEQANWWPSIGRRRQAPNA
jgi:RND superfamily putative drug exporter